MTDRDGGSDKRVLLDIGYLFDRKQEMATSDRHYKLLVERKLI